MKTRCPNRGQSSEVRGQGSGRVIANCELQIANCKLQTVAGGRQWAADSVKPQAVSLIFHSSSFILHPSSFRRGFTLVELLVTITIIGILAGLSLGAIRYARNSAAEAKTKATIAKLNAIIMKQYESYMNRRMPTITPNPINLNEAKPTQAMALIRLDLLRDLMRMEMPERWSDVIDIPLAYHHTRTTTLGTTYDLTYSFPYESALKRAYRERYSQANTYLVNVKGMSIADADKLIQENGGPECLYLIVTMSNPEAMEQFSQNEIGDVDGDTCPEFIDGWGKPISFLRWAPGFNNSDVQPNITWNSIAQRLSATNNDHDPFDANRVDVQQLNDIGGSDTDIPTGWDLTYIPTGWRLVPLIYSFGPDKEEGIYSASVYNYHGNPYESISGGGMQVGIGTPKIIAVGPPIKYTTEHFDNITNHRIEQK